ncbi:unnamed protein product [Lupinus luteus]|uniref:non-specific serine/threonine protein kinase n=1 Tax=Lupinus luteus TaxID=3873 RepID=A0AAV1VXT9_LUPLU
MQMKKTSGPSLDQLNQRKRNDGFQDKGADNGTNSNNVQNHSTLTYLKYAAKKCAEVFTFFLFEKRKTTSEVVESDERENTHKVRELSSATDLSSKSNYSHSYASPSTSSSQLGPGNFSFEEIYKATAKFSPENKIGEGGFGTVYKGKLSNGPLVAVKRAKKHGDEKIIVVEYINNGTLREHLNGTGGHGLEMGELLDIAIDVAHAVTYLHMYTDHPIIHRDIKASNILITDNLRAKVADFGFARLATEDPDATHISTQVKGTLGYVDPDYMRTHQLTEKSDVYSFGVLLVEMITGRHPIEPKKQQNEIVTIRWALQMWKQGEILIAMDPRLQRSSASNKAVEKVFRLAYQCLAPARKSRPSMKTCAEVLWGIRKDFRDKAFPHSPLDSHHSAKYPGSGAKNNKHKPFVSA